MKIGKLWSDGLAKHGYTLDSFLDDYRMSREQLEEELEFWIDEMLGYNGVVEPETVADDEVEYQMAIIHLFKDNAKHIDKDSICLYQDYRKYSIQRVWKLSFWTDKLYKNH